MHLMADACAALSHSCNDATMCINCNVTILTCLRHHAVWQRSHGYFLGYKPDIISAVRFGQESDYDGSRVVPPPPVTPIPTRWVPDAGNTAILAEGILRRRHNASQT